VMAWRRGWLRRLLHGFCKAVLPLTTWVWWQHWFSVGKRRWLASGRGLWFGGRASVAAAHDEGDGCEVAVDATCGSAGSSRLRLACGCGWHGCG
jgi:hypothetical protein